MEKSLVDKQPQASYYLITSVYPLWDTKHFSAYSLSNYWMENLGKCLSENDMALPAVWCYIHEYSSWWVYKWEQSLQHCNYMQLQKISMKMMFEFINIIKKSKNYTWWKSKETLGINMEFGLSRVCPDPAFKSLWPQVFTQVVSVVRSPQLIEFWM